jgi:large subunit ribosomal protein L18
MLDKKNQQRQARKRRMTARIRGTSERPRLSVTRSLKAISAQVIDDTTGKTLAAASSASAKAKPTVEGAKKVGMMVAEKAKAAGVTKIVFDRNAYQYHGQVKALAEGAREGGLDF